MESNEDVSALLTFRDALIGLPLSHFWRGHGSAIFLEFGRLTPTTRRCACRKLNPGGILVMQSAQGWATKNMPGAIDGARNRCIFFQG